MTRKADSDLLKAANEAILMASQNGSLHHIFVRYRMWNETQMMRGLETGNDDGFVGSLTFGAAEVPSPADEKISSFEQSSG